MPKKTYMAHHSTAAIRYHSFKAGDRVKVSVVARERGIFKMAHPLREGTITGKADQYRSAVSVLWDGLKTSNKVASIFLELVPKKEVDPWE